MILTNDAELAKKFNSAIFPGIQGGPLMHVIAAKAVAFGEALKPDFKHYIKQVINTQLVECFVDFDYNGNIILRSISTKHISYDNLQNLLSNIINPLVDKINSFIQSSGYVMQKFSSLENELVEIIHLDYHLSIQLNPTFDLHKYDQLLYVIFDIKEFTKPFILHLNHLISCNYH